VDRHPITPDGLKKLQAELKNIREVIRPANVKAIEEARELGDLSENAEYQYAKEHQSLIAGRIEYIEERIAFADVIDVSKLSGDRVLFGAKVTLEDIESGDEKKYRILGEDETDIEAGIISISSPIARGLIRKEVGDEVKIVTPSGTRAFEIIDVEF
jgi:transcription elongation factor GreA